jgi:hypothetical protein
LGSRFSPAAFLLPRRDPLQEVHINELRVNGAIRAKEVLVIAPDGAQIGVK